VFVLYLYAFCIVLPSLCLHAMRLKNCCFLYPHFSFFISVFLLPCFCIAYVFSLSLTLLFHPTIYLGLAIMHNWLLSLWAFAYSPYALQPYVDHCCISLSFSNQPLEMQHIHILHKVSNLVALIRRNK